MSKHAWKGDGREVKGALRAKWGKLTDDVREAALGHHERIFGLLRKRYGLMREDAEQQLQELTHHHHT